MARFIQYIILLMSFIIVSCEQVYYTDIDDTENYLVVEARFFIEDEFNFVRLMKSRDFYADENFVPVTDASVSIIDDKHRNYQLEQTEIGTFKVPFKLKKEQQYKIAIQYEGETFESEYEKVPDIPEVDSIYGLPEVKTLDQDGENDIDKFLKIGGLQLYMDKVTDSARYYLFTSKYIQQYIIDENFQDDKEQLYSWQTIYPDGIFNVAGPPENSTSSNIIKHPLFFIENTPQLPASHYFMGWIVILYQHEISKNNFKYYSDLNTQLSSDGKLFDPMYIQARNNIRCVSDPQKIVLGNFEILAVKEYRFYVKYLGGNHSHILKPIPYFYEISERDTTIGIPPDFWETSNKIYPNEN